MKPILFNTEMVGAILDGRKTQTRRVIKDNNKVKQITLDRLCGICGFFDEQTMNYGCTNPECGETGEDINGKEHGRCFSWSCPFGQEWGYEDDCESSFDGDTYMNIPIPNYQVGDILWVREPAKVISFTDDGNYGGSYIEASAIVKYLADGKEVFWDEFPENAKSWLWECKGIPNGCCKSLARIFLHVTNVRVERLQDISHDDIYAEGLDWKNFECDNGQSENDVFKWWQTLWNSTAKDGYKWKDNPYVFVYEFEKASEATHLC